MKFKDVLFMLASPVLAASALDAQVPASFPAGKINVAVVNESAHPVADAMVEVSFVVHTFENPIIEDTKVRTPPEGVVAAEGKCDRFVGYSAQKDGSTRSADRIIIPLTPTVAGSLGTRRSRRC